MTSYHFEKSLTKNIIIKIIYLPRKFGISIFCTHFVPKAIGLEGFKNSFPRLRGIKFWVSDNV